MASPSSAITSCTTPTSSSCTSRERPGSKFGAGGMPVGEAIEMRRAGRSKSGRAVEAPRESSMGTALIVEDHPEQADLVSRILRLRDYQPILAEDGEAGLRLAREQHPDVMLLDLMLPDINGFDVCRRLRTDPAT